MIKNYEEVIEKLKTKFIDYLEEKEINTKQNFPCLSPDHEDTHGSMGVVPQSNFTRAHCFACGSIADIFDAVHVLEGKPKSGPNYIEETVMYLAEKYQIGVELKELTEEEKYRIECFNGYKEAAKYISTNASNRAVDDMKRRGWDPEGCKDRLIGGVKSFTDYKAHMKAQGFAVSFMENIDLLNPALFSESNLVFTIQDQHGRACGFSSRNLDWDKDAEGANRRKYINTSARCPIYEKSKRLYNIHNTKTSDGTIFVTEGCADTEAMVQRGITNTVGICGTSFTDYHVIELSKSARTNITLVTDGDAPGIKAANRMIEKLSEHRDFSINLIIFPDGMDPDDFLQENDVAAFRNLRRWTAFEWKLDSYDAGIDTVLIKKEIIPIVASEGSPIERERMIKVLSLHIDIHADAIREEVQQILDANEHKKTKERDSVIKNLMAELRVDPTSWRHAINEASTSLESLSEKYTDDSFSAASYLRELEMFKEEEEDTEDMGASCYFHKWREFQEAIEGNHEATLNVIGGGANCGKTAMMSGLALQLATIPTSYEINYSVIFHTIDDTLKQFTTRLITQLALDKYSEITLNMVKKPGKYQEAKLINEAREHAYKKFLALVQEGRIIVKGGEEKGAATLTYADEMIKSVKKINKAAGREDWQIVYFLDNFHRLRDFQGADERTRFKKLSGGAKDLAKYHKIPIWATMEYNKTVGTGRPTNNSISESIAMEYDANLIMHLYNDMHVKNQLGEDPDFFFQRSDSNGRFYKSPRIEAIIGKNKLNSFKGSLWFDFYTDQSRMHPVAQSTVQGDVDRTRAEKADRGGAPSGAGNGGWQNRQAG
jgi:DNA primase